MTNYTYNGAMQQGLPFSGMISQAQNNHTGPLGLLPPGTSTYLGEGQGGYIAFDGSTNRLIALGLITCAAVIFVSTDAHAHAGAYVYHAKSGTIPGGTVQTARAALGNPPIGSLLVIYTFPKPTDPNYVADAQSIVNAGVPAANVIFASNLAASQFGISSACFVGM